MSPALPCGSKSVVITWHSSDGYYLTCKEVRQYLKGEVMHSILIPDDNKDVSNVLYQL